MMDLGDRYQRNFKNLRVSLLSNCNLGCVYCTMGTAEEELIRLKPQTSADKFIENITKLHHQLSLKTVRLTGGEPLLYRQLAEVIEGISNLQIPDIKLTTNGFLLERTALALKNAGLKSVNVSLDAIDEAIFFRMTRRNHLSKVLNGISAALDCGLQVKLNAVIMKGFNEDQILPLLDYAFENNIQIRFLEVMAMGHLHNKPETYLFRQDDILAIASTKYKFVKLPRTPSSTANYWQTESGQTFGIIANESEPFCSDCNRLRLDSEGNIYGCLSVNQPISIHNVQSQALNDKLIEAMQQKQTVKFVGSSLSMLEIGG